MKKHWLASGLAMFMLAFSPAFGGLVSQQYEPADMVIKGNTTVAGGALAVRSLTVMNGVVSLGDASTSLAGAINITEDDATFGYGAALMVMGGTGSISLPNPFSQLEVRKGAVLNLAKHPLIIEHGSALLHGTMVVGLMTPGDASLLTFLTVPAATGVVTISDSFMVKLTDDLTSSYRNCPEDIVADAIVVDAVIKHARLQDGKTWTHLIPHQTGDFFLKAKLGVLPADGGGIRLNPYREEDATDES